MPELFTNWWHAGMPEPLFQRRATPQPCLKSGQLKEFFGMLKDMVYADGWEAADMKQLIAQIRAKIRAFPTEKCQNLFRGLKTKVRRVADRGHAALLEI